MTYFQVLSLPLTTFWSFNRQVDRLKAEDEQRQLRVLAASQSPEGARELGDFLERQIGRPVIIEEKFDTDKFEELKQRFSKQRVQNEPHTE